MSSSNTLVRPTKYFKSSHPEKAFQQFDLMRREGRFTDIVLVADGRKFQAHRSVLCACSPYFDRMFQPGFVEQENNEVILKDFDAETLAVLLDYMYTTEITITEENAQDILIGSNLLLLYNVRETAGEVLVKLIDDNNVLDIRNIGSMFSCRDIESRAHNYMLERFEYVCKTEEFLKLDSDEILKYLLLDDIIVRSEESLFDCIVRWIEKDPDKRKQHFDKLVEAVRFPLVSDHCLNKLMNENEYVQSSEKCKQIIQDSVRLKSQHIYSRPFIPSNSLIPQYRGSNQLLFLQCANTSPWLKTPPVLYDFKKNSWSSLNGPHHPCKYREDSCYLFHSGSVYSIGGEFTLETGDPRGLVYPPVLQQPGPSTVQIELDADVYASSLEDKTWSIHSKLKLPRKRHQSVMLGDQCYVIGGCTVNSQPTDSVEILDMGDSSREWTEAPPMLHKRVSHGAVELNGYIYVIGGWGGQGIVKSVERYNPEKRIWQEVSKYDKIRMKSGVAALDGKIYVVGGCLQTLETCYKAEVFDPDTSRWIDLPPSKHTRSNPVLVPYRGKLYVFGGEGNSQGLVECFDPFTQEWTVLDTRIKTFVNGAYAGCLVDKPWDWDIQPNRSNLMTNNMQKILSGVGLDVVQTLRNYWQNEISD